MWCDVSWCDVYTGLDVSLVCSPQRTPPGTRLAVASCGRRWLQWPCVSWSSSSPSAFSCAAGSGMLAPPRDPCKTPHPATVGFPTPTPPPQPWSLAHSVPLELTLLFAAPILHQSVLWYYKTQGFMRYFYDAEFLHERPKNSPPLNILACLSHLTSFLISFLFFLN